MLGSRGNQARTPGYAEDLRRTRPSASSSAAQRRGRIRVLGGAGGAWRQRRHEPVARAGARAVHWADTGMLCASAGSPGACAGQQRSPPADALQPDVARSAVRALNGSSAAATVTPAAFFSQSNPSLNSLTEGPNQTTRPARRAARLAAAPASRRRRQFEHGQRKILLNGHDPPGTHPPSNGSTCATVATRSSVEWKQRGSCPWGVPSIVRRGPVAPRIVRRARA